MSDDRTVVSPPVSVAAPMMQSMASAPSVPSQQVNGQLPARAKESGGGSEKIPYVEVNAPSIGVETEPLPLEVKEWMEQSENSSNFAKLPTVSLPNPPAPSTTTQTSGAPVFVLPLGELEAKQALHTSVHESIRWLAVWCQRIVKKLGAQAVYRQASS